MPSIVKIDMHHLVQFIGEQHIVCLAQTRKRWRASVPCFAHHVIAVAAAAELRVTCVPQGTQMALEKGGVKCERVLKIQEGRPNAGDMLKNGEISMLLLTTTGKRTRSRKLCCHLEEAWGTSCSA